MSVDLTSKYLGFVLKNPLVASASPLTRRLDVLKRLEDAGISACVLPSLFEEQIEHEEMEIGRLRDLGANSFAEAAGGYFPELDTYNTGPDSYLESIAAAKEALAIPVFGSLNGVSAGGWVRYAKLMEDAGADGIELNIYFVAADPEVSGGQVEQRYIELVETVRRSVTVPLAVKIHPFFSSPVHMARRLFAAGADGLVLFNRFMAPDIDLETLEVTPHLELSRAGELRLPLRWTAIMKFRVDGDLAATTGVQRATDVVKLVMAGADAVQIASIIMKQGVLVVPRLLEGIERWMEAHEYTSIEQLKGSLSQIHAPDPGAFERANYMAALLSYTPPILR